MFLKYDLVWLRFFISILPLSELRGHSFWNAGGLKRKAGWSRHGNELALWWHVASERVSAANEVAELRGQNLLEVVRSVNRVIAESEKNVASDKNSSKCVRCASEREWEKIVILNL